MFLLYWLFIVSVSVSDSLLMNISCIKLFLYGLCVEFEHELSAGLRAGVVYLIADMKSRVPLKP